jgi:hypothetical protein
LIVTDSSSSVDRGVHFEDSATSYYDITVKPLITKEEVSNAISQLVGQGKKPTLIALHATL